MWIKNPVVEQQKDYTNLRYMGKAITEAGQPYVSWPHQNSWCDGSLVHQVYTAGPTHISTSSKIYIRSLDYRNTDIWGGSTLVVDRLDEGCICLGSGMAPNGDFVVHANAHSSGYTGKKFYHYRSTDKGQTWASEGEVNMPNANAEFIMSWQPTMDGSIICSVYNTDNTMHFIRSTDNGYTWSVIPITNPYTFTRGPSNAGFLQLPDKTIIAILRKNIGATGYSSERDSAYFSISKDDGLSWTDIAVTDIDDMTRTNASLIYHPDTNLVEVFYGSRYGQPEDGFGSIYQSVTTPELAKKGIFGTPKRLAKGASYEMTSNSSDFAYPSVVRTPEGQVILTYYDLLSYHDGVTETAIYMFRN